LITILTAEPRIDFYFFNSTAKTNSATRPMRPLDPPIVETMLVILPITSAPNRAPVPNNISANIEIETTPSPISVIAVIPLFIYVIMLSIDLYLINILRSFSFKLIKVPVTNRELSLSNKINYHSIRN